MNTNENISTTNTLDSYWKDLLLSIRKFTDVNQTKKSLADIYKDGTSVFSKLPYSQFSSLFLLNDNGYSFDLKTTNPINSCEFVTEVFDILIENGQIGTAIESATAINTKVVHHRYSDLQVLITPLRASFGINGIVLVFHSHTDTELDNSLYQIIGLFANLFGSTIENHRILYELENSKSTLEQKIATRTIDLAQSRRELKAIFDSVLTGIIIYDLNINKIVRVNPVACKIIGASDMDIVGKNVFDFLEYMDYGRIADNVANQQHYESILTTYGKSEIPVLRNTTKILLNNRVLINESFIDISKIKEAEIALTQTNQLLELKVMERTEDLQVLVHKLKEEIRDREDAEAKIRRMYEEQKELSDLKTRFVSMVSHEFRTPLTLIKSSAQMVTKFQDALTTDEYNNYLERIVYSVDSLTDLIENVIFIGKSDAHKYTINRTEIKVKELLNEVVDYFLINNNILIKFEIIVEPNLINVYSDARLLKIILSNLISNAIKYSGNEGVIRIEADIVDEYLMFLVEDNGIGIPDDEQDKIFDLFYRAKNVSAISGTGLGLTVVTDSLSKLNGRIEIKSRVNLGSVFKVFVPLKVHLGNNI